MGYWEYPEIAAEYHVPITVTGFEPVDLLNGILMNVQQLEAGNFEVTNAYARVVSREGNIPAQKMMRQVFEVCDRNWRGIGLIPMSGLRLTREYDEFNAERRFEVGEIQTRESENMHCGSDFAGNPETSSMPCFWKLCAILKIHWAQPWYPLKALVRRIIGMPAPKERQHDRTCPSDL